MSGKLDNPDFILYLCHCNHKVDSVKLYIKEEADMLPPFFLNILVKGL